MLGVIPDNKDKELLFYSKKNPNFWNKVRKWKEKGWEIGMHGTNHVYDKFCSKIDYLGHGGNTEFCGHSFRNQLEKIKMGLKERSSMFSTPYQAIKMHLMCLEILECLKRQR